MANDILLGPILGLEFETTYSVIVLLKAGTPLPQLSLSRDGKSLPSSTFKKIGAPAIGEFYRAVFDVPLTGKASTVEYKIAGKDKALLANAFGDATWSFYVPAQKGEIPKIAFATCNGFSDGKLARNTKEPYRLWQHLEAAQSKALEHFKLGTLAKPDDAPCSLLLLGGDQLYADEIFSSARTPIVSAWALMNTEDQVAWPDKKGTTRRPAANA